MRHSLHLHGKSFSVPGGIEIKRLTMSNMLHRLQEDEEIARENHMRLELYRLVLQRKPGITDQKLDALQVQIDAAFNLWRVAKEKLDEGEKRFSVLPA